MDAVPPRIESPVAPSARRVRWAGLWIVVCHTLILSACLFVFLRGWDRDFQVPFRFAQDGLVAEMQSKSTIDNGWWWFNPRLGAPFGLDELQFPANSNVDQALVFIVSRVVRDPAMAINLTWCLMVVLSGLTATWCIRVLGASTQSALMAGTLFALSPFALYRNIGQFWLVIYLVPFACTAAALIAQGRPQHWTRDRSFIVVLGGCTLIAFNYIYYAFFACFLLIVASLTGFLQYRAAHVLGAGALCVALVGAGTFLNLTPSLYSWHERGKPLIVHDKGPAESEGYGLKIRQLVSPGLWHSFPPFRAWLAREQAAAFPLDNENTRSRLGLVATLGFLSLLGLLFVPRATQSLAGGRTLLATSQLSLAAVLLGTIGGFGSLFSLLISPQIRAYNRIAPFILFLSLVAVAFLIDSLVTRPRRRVAAAILIAAVGLADQRAAAEHLNAAHEDLAAEVATLKTLVGELESRLPAGAMVFQLPLRLYLNEDEPNRMGAYEHFKPYLVSHALRWSYPALSNQQVRWQQAAALLPPDRLALELAAAGFAAIMIDRRGYPDDGAALVTALRQLSPHPALIGDTPRYAVLDIRSFASDAMGSAYLQRAAGSSPATEGLPACGAAPLFSIERIGEAKAPFGPEPTHVSGDIKVSGWAVDQAARSAGAGMDLLIDGTPLQTIYGLYRSDVSDLLQLPAYRPSGFLAGAPMSRFGKGPHALALRLVSTDGRCYYETPAQPVVVD